MKKINHKYLFDVEYDKQPDSVPQRLVKCICTNVQMTDIIYNLKYWQIEKALSRSMYTFKTKGAGRVNTGLMIKE